jgi:hypothetical protein
MADINHEIKVHAAPEDVYRALTDASELAKWHTAGTSGEGNTFTTHPHDGPIFEWKVLESLNRTLTPSSGNAQPGLATPSAPSPVSSCLQQTMDGRL